MWVNRRPDKPSGHRASLALRHLGIHFGSDFVGRFFCGRCHFGVSGLCRFHFGFVGRFLFSFHSFGLGFGFRLGILGFHFGSRSSRGCGHTRSLARCRRNFG